MMKIRKKKRKKKIIKKSDGAQIVTRNIKMLIISMIPALITLEIVSFLGIVCKSKIP
jgi:hypothetical protein